MSEPVPVTEHLTLEWHRLELRFAATRLAPRQSLAGLERSLAEAGQLRPLIAVPAPQPATPTRFVLIDGYRRLGALRRLGRDTAWVEVWACDTARALVALLAHAQSRPFEPLEQALLLRELAREGGLSQHALARALGRDVSWISRRLALLTALSEPLLAAVCAGQISTWAAVRVLVPLARANPAHAEALLAALRQAPLSTRELGRWLAHYQEASAATRERLVAHPALFARAEQARADQQQARALAQGPEGAWEADCMRAERLLASLRTRLARLAGSALAPELEAAFARLTQAFTRLAHDLERYRRDDPDAHPRAGPAPCRAGDAATRDESPAAPLAQHHPSPPTRPAPPSATGARAPL
jgi:ParB/RepB/Spo0J family partition protein